MTPTLQPPGGPRFPYRRQPRYISSVPAFTLVHVRTLQWNSWAAPRHTSASVAHVTMAIIPRRRHEKSSLRCSQVGAGHTRCSSYFLPSNNQLYTAARLHRRLIKRDRRKTRDATHHMPPPNPVPAGKSIVLSVPLSVISTVCLKSV
jgi:hypothetical protein